MKVKELLSELQDKDSFKEFREKHQDSYFSTAFFILSKGEKDGDKIQLDYFIPSLEKLASFEYPFNTFKVHDDKIPLQKEIKDLNFKLDLDNLKDRIKEETNKEPNKVIAVLQNDEWNITCIDGLDLKRIKIDAYSGKVHESGDLKMTDIIQFRKAS